MDVKYRVYRKAHKIIQMEECWGGGHTAAAMGTI